MFRETEGSIRSINRGLYVQPTGSLDVGPGGGIPDLGPFRLTTPSYDEVFATGVAVARRKLRKLPADLVITGETRFSDHEPESLKRLAAMNAWAEEYPGVELEEGELKLLSGTTVERLVFYMQRKILMVEGGVKFSPEELEELEVRMPKLPEGSEQLPPDELKARENLIHDNATDLLLRAMDVKLAQPSTDKQ